MEEHMRNINGVDFILMCQEQHLYAPVVWRRTAIRKYEKQKEEKRRYYEKLAIEKK
jgi:hypothetical protein